MDSCSRLSRLTGPLTGRGGESARVQGGPPEAPHVGDHAWADEYCCESERAREDGWATSDRRRAV